MQPFESAYLKLNRAKEHLHALSREIAAFLQRDPYRIVCETNVERTEYVYRVNIVEEIPARFGIVVGDCLYNLRSCLDHLAWQLAGQPVGAVAERIAFPIFDTRSGYSKAVKKKLFGVGEDAKAIIEQLQPYHRDDQWFTFEPHPLSVLYQLSNFDKHRALHLVWFNSHTAEIQTSAVPVEQLMRGGRLVDQAEVARFRFAESNVEMKVRFNILVEMQLERPQITLPAIQYLSFLSDFIRFDVLPKFEPLLS